MSVNLSTLVQKLQTSTPEEFFGTLDLKVKDASLTILKQLYRRYALHTHPDRQVTGEDVALARQGFIKLKELYDEAVRRVENGTYGTRVALASLKTKVNTYEIARAIASGDLATIYLASTKKEQVLLKLARDAHDNDLLQREAEVVKTLQERVVEAGLRATGHFIPRLVESAIVKVKNQNKRVNVFEVTKSQHIPLTELVSYFPGGVDQLHFIWIFRRLLTTLGFAHSVGVVHGAILPTHVLINPKDHGIQLIDWCYSTPRNTPLHAISTGYKNWYPPEVFDKRGATPATDIYMAAKTMEFILAGGARVHPALVRFLDTCVWAHPNRRPQDAWELHDSFSKITKTIFGPRKFVPLVLPT